MTTPQSKYQVISPYLLQQLRNECIDWKRQLDNLLVENIRQKNVLAEVLQTNAIEVRDHLEEAEQFQNEFLRLDAALKLMRSDISRQDGSLDKYHVAEDYRDTILMQQNTLRNEMVAIDGEFQFIRYNFYTYLAAFS